MARNINLQVKLTSKSKKKFENKMNNLMKFVQPNRALAQLLGNLAMDIKAEAAMKAPVDNGDLRKSGYMEGSNFNLEVGFNAEYARAVEFGTAPHIIRSKKGKILTNYNSLRQGQKKKAGDEGPCRLQTDIATYICIYIFFLCYLYVGRILLSPKGSHIICFCCFCWVCSSFRIYIYIYIYLYLYTRN